MAELPLLKWRGMVPGEIRALAERAGDEIMTIYRGDFETRVKDGGSPVTDADERAEDLIIAGLRRLTPDIPVIAEESIEREGMPTDIPGRFYLVDPLDGTREFVNRRDEFTVNIALIEQGVPVGGVVHLPALGETFYTDHDGSAFRTDRDAAAQPIRCRMPPAGGLTVVASRSHRDAETEELLARLAVGELISCGSSLKLCRVAEGRADLYPRMGRTMEWDIAAGDAVVRAAGGRVMRFDGTPLEYGKASLDNPAFLALGAGDPRQYGLDIAAAGTRP